ncbi:SRPBCC family protein [Nocardioides sp. YIM 152315]|uniref:SRPBCC family protein n=1 Tax=Nocardioides sp. YIM 152315 TaxID=3031760 RepID=UPI0023DA44E3|nr:SRPBCC family protein [Nocardioides sp. YIM 152315]MDF1605817.1 SRPBCC family protein [Nocardioides sp. YIM 152315]
MKLTHSFVVGLEPQEAFDLLLDVPRIATCMPGAALTEVNGDDFAGTVKVKLGPVVMTYNGKAKIVERDRDGLKAKIELSGRDVKGTSDASATVDAILSPSGDDTEVQLITDLAITGKPAQLGRGLMNDVGRKIIGQFADALAKDIEATKNPQPGEPTVGSTRVPGEVHAAPEPNSPSAEPVDLLSVAGVPDKRLLAAGGLVVVLLVLLIRRWVSS